MDDNTYRSFAFISYSHRDMKEARWLQRRLEGFRLPTEIHNDVEAGTRYLRPIFRDQSDLNTGILPDELRKNLEESKYLILICSKSSARSQWVSDEAKTFVGLGRLDKIIPVMIPDPDGELQERDLFPQFLREYFAEHPDKELLGVNIGEVGKEKALIRIVSRMLDVSFDTLWKRHQRQRRMMIGTVAALGLLVAAALYLFAVPVDLSVKVDMQRAMLPTGETVTMKVNGAEYVTSTEEPAFDDIRLPGYKRFTDVKVEVDSKFYNPIDTTVATGFGVSRDLSLTLQRDNTFGQFTGHVFDANMNPLEDVVIKVDEQVAVSDLAGAFSISVPLERQRPEMTITLEKEGYKKVVREDEVPGTDLRFVMYD